MRQYAVLVVLILAVFLLYTLFPHPVQPLTEEQAQEFVMQDLAPLNAESSIISSGKTGDTWEFEVLVARDAHTPCPTVEKRFYKLPPVSFRPEPFISSCYERNSILFREEALINSAKKLGISDGYGCAFKANANWALEQSYCPKADFANLTAFAVDLPAGSWVAYWDVGGQVKMIALDVNGIVVKTSS